MHGLDGVDGSRQINWGRTSGDYAAWRPDYPPEFYRRLLAGGVGRRGQRIIDLGTGVGFLARQFARQGCVVTGVDISEGQIRTAIREAASEALSIDFLARPAERTGLPAASADAVTASQCWLYFDQSAAIREVRRLLRPRGLLVTSHFSWLPRQDPIAEASEALVRKHNPDWSAGNWSGDVPRFPPWAVGHFELVEAFVFDAPIPFTRESWRGRIRACRGVGAALSDAEVEGFDREHKQVLQAAAGDTFTVLHRVDAHLLRPASG